MRGANRAAFEGDRAAFEGGNRAAFEDISGIGREIRQDAAVAALAVGQHGNVTRRQLLALGLNDDAIAHRVATGRLFRVHVGVYSVGRPPSTPLEGAAAAVLACGDGAGLAHFSALTLWGLRKHWETPFHVVIRANRRPTGIRVHRTTTLTRRDLTTHFGIRVTSPARTLLDCAADLADKALTRAVNEALLSRHLSRAALADVLARNRNHRGVARLAPFAESEQEPTRSTLEDEFTAFCKRYGLPTPRLNVVVAGRERDAYFEAERLIVEIDSWTFHKTRASFEDDRDRDAQALAQDIATVRLTRERMRTRPEIEADRLLGILAMRRR